VNAAAANADIARVLETVAALLEAQDANPFRVRSYRNAASRLRESTREAADLLRESGPDGLRAIEGVGEGLARTIAEIVETGRSSLLDRLEAENAPEALLMRLPGVGPRLAQRLHDELGVHTFEELEQAAAEGRLEQVEGVGRKKAETIRAAIAGMLGARRFRGARPAGARPGVATLLAIDAEYREKGAAGELATIAPRRFNPTHERWLPVLHARRDGWEFTALFSNTQRAHELGRTRDWVVIYYHRNGAEDQCTVVSATTGPLAGRRVVRGRESECRALAANALRAQNTF
jgi:predicted flap endonuclease-1-like 5' DNA nuclease